MVDADHRLCLFIKNGDTCGQAHGHFFTVDQQNYVRNLTKELCVYCLKARTKSKIEDDEKKQQRILNAMKKKVANSIMLRFFDGLYGSDEKATIALHKALFDYFYNNIDIGETEVLPYYYARDKVEQIFTGMYYNLEYIDGEVRLITDKPAYTTDEYSIKEMQRDYTEEEIQEIAEIEGMGFLENELLTAIFIPYQEFFDQRYHTYGDRDNRSKGYYNLYKFHEKTVELDYIKDISDEILTKFEKSSDGIFNHIVWLMANQYNLSQELEEDLHKFLLKRIPLNCKIEIEKCI